MSSPINDEVQVALSKSSAAIEDLLTVATQQEQAISTLKAANAELTKQRVILEKVASEKSQVPAVDPAGIDRVVDELVSSGYFSNEDGVKVAADLKKSPEGLLKLASTLIRLNNPSTEGEGIPRNQSVKKASTATDEWELDGWTKCFS